VKPNRPATTDTTKKISAHFRIVIAQVLRLLVAGFGDLTASRGTGSSGGLARGWI
jgi:hypothetical protein